MRQNIIVVLLVALALSSCSRKGTFQKSEPLMGTQVSITVVAESRSEGEAAIDACLGELKRFDRMMSLYRDDSEVSRVNLEAGKHPVRVSPEMIEAVEAANRISALSHGTFDITEMRRLKG